MGLYAKHAIRIGAAVRDFDAARSPAVFLDAGEVMVSLPLKDPAVMSLDCGDRVSVRTPAGLGADWAEVRAIVCDRATPASCAALLAIPRETWCATWDAGTKDILGIVKRGTP